jgi:hypothetical protein
MRADESRGRLDDPGAPRGFSPYRRGPLPQTEAPKRRAGAFLQRRVTRNEKGAVPKHDARFREREER